ncbi:MAG: hypothetical protein Q4G16_10995 [Cruoricaptor ignavus]|nr:hypothetical protein [Cruoricaptor ignavus]
MIKKLHRDYCIIKFRNLPLQHCDKETNSDIFYTPKHKGFYWIKLPDSKKDGSKQLISELIKLMGNLKINHLIFLDEINKPWISKLTAERTNYKKLIKALEYFKFKKIWTKFNGGIFVSKDCWKDFLTHFYTITKCDSSFFYYNFIDEKQNIIFHIHYSGEINIITLNSEIDSIFLNQIKNTKFIDCDRVNTNKIIK